MVFGVFLRSHVCVHCVFVTALVSRIFLFCPMYLLSAFCLPYVSPASFYSFLVCTCFCSPCVPLCISSVASFSCTFYFPCISLCFSVPRISCVSLLCLPYVPQLSPLFLVSHVYPRVSLLCAVSSSVSAWRRVPEAATRRQDSTP